MKSEKNFIIETIKKIDELQKRHFTEDETCVGCESGLLTVRFDTIPVSFKTECGHKVKANLDFCGHETEFYRIESLRENRYAILRLLKVEEKRHEKPEQSNRRVTLEGTKLTAILDLETVGELQCYQAINIDCE